jgi:hypothetical protein
MKQMFLQRCLKWSREELLLMRRSAVVGDVARFDWPICVPAPVVLQRVLQWVHDLAFSADITLETSGSPASVPGRPF